MKYDFLISKLKNLVASERKITAEVIDLIREVDQKRIYLEYGYTSMFAMLTKDFGYTPSAAMRRIDAARLSKELPEVSESLKDGELNLSQVSMVAQAIRQKEKEDSKILKNSKVSTERKSILLEKVKSLDLIETQKTLAKDLDLKVQKIEKKTYQQDESVRIEATFTKEQYTNLQRVKELISHQNPNPSIGDLIDFLANQFLDRKDPLRKAKKIDRIESEGVSETLGTDSDITSALTAAPVPASRQKSKAMSANRSIPQKIRVEVFKRDQCCQWEEVVTNENGQKTKRKCQSRFQLQVDHVKPRWRDGNNDLVNLQLLCGVHNRLKYKLEVIGRSPLDKKVSQIEILD